MNQGYHSLIAYKKSFNLALEVYVISKLFPQEEKYSLTNQLRRSGRSICANLAEAYRKRLYPRHFISKLSDAHAETAETQFWLEFAHAFGMLDEAKFKELFLAYDEVSKLISFMMTNPKKFS